MSINICWLRVIIINASENASRRLAPDPFCDRQVVEAAVKTPVKICRGGMAAIMAGR